jgi:ribosomal protein S18 acetylase RimI-like enzyme
LKLRNLFLMEITQAKPNELIEILYLLKVCIRDMSLKGLKHWSSASPDTVQIQNDLQNGSIYLVKDKGVCKGMVTLNDREPEDYKQVSFPENKSRPFYLHQMVVHPKWQGTGIARMMIDFAQKHASEKGFDCLRLDVFTPSETARKLCEKNNFKEVGSFLTNYQKIPFICYEKQL